VLFHDDGKASLDHIYTESDPRAYFSTLRGLEYQIPQTAKACFTRLIEQLRASRRAVTVLDIGCSYGINPALLRCDATMAELYQRYVRSSEPREALVARDRALLADRNRWPDTRFVGLDVSAPALAYAEAAGFVDTAVRADLEHDEPTPRQRIDLGAADLVVSTGCVGYVTEQTIGRVIRSSRDCPPWMAHYVLRMYPFDPIDQCLVEYGYETLQIGPPVRQRRFVSKEEQSQVLDTLSGIGQDPCGLEADGWLYAQLFVSRPRGG
jgi:carnitine O-acetyltransferase